MYVILKNGADNSSDDCNDLVCNNNHFNNNLSKVCRLQKRRGKDCPVGGRQGQGGQKVL